MDALRSCFFCSALIISLFSSQASANTTLTFNVTGWFSWLTNDGSCCAFDGLRHAITGTLQYDINSGTGTIIIDPFLSSGSNTLFNAPVSLEAIGDGAGGAGTLVLGNTLFEWSPTSNLPVSIVWDATGLLNYTNAGVFTVTDVVTGGVLPESDNTVGPPPIGVAPLATTSWNTTSLCTPGSCIGVTPSGALPLITDLVVDTTNGDIGIGGSPMIDGPFSGLNVNLDLTSLTLSSVVTIPDFINVAPSMNITGSGVGANNGNGLAWIDYDNDGWDDLYIVSGGGADNKLYRNMNGTGFSLVTTSGTELNGKPGTGATVADFDNDGWDDIFVTNSDTSNFANSKNTLLKNNGDGTFSDVTAAMHLDAEEKPSYGAAFGDVDGDGDLDLYVGHWGGPTFGNDYYKNLLAENGGTADFVRVDLGITDIGHTFTVLMTDYDNDGDLDLYSVNDSLNSDSLTKAFRNDGVDVNGNPIFVLENTSAGLNFLINGMGAATADVNRDGFLDYHVSGFCPDNVVLTNNGSNQFSNTGPVTPTGTCWGAVFADIDNDGDSDLYVGNNAFGSSTSGTNFLFTNDGTGVFSQRNSPSAEVIPGFGIAMADFDHDGRIDFAVQDANGQIELLKNNIPFVGNHWLSIRLNGTGSNKRGIGSKIRVTSTGPSGTITQLQEVQSGSSHGSTHSYAIHFGFEPGSTINSIIIEWPEFGTQTITGPVNLDQVMSIQEPITPSFVAVASSLGVSGSLNGVSNGNGLAWIDYDNDGWDDLYIVSASGSDNKLYRNVNGSAFTLVMGSGSELNSAPSTGATIADFDNDGWDDIFVTNSFDGVSTPSLYKNTLLRNNGDGTFADVTAAMHLDVEEKVSYTAAFGDVDGDGDLDLYVGHWGSAGPTMGNDFYRNLLVENGGTADFVRVDLGITDIGHTFAVLMTDFDNDGDLDLYSINDNLNTDSLTKIFRNDGLDLNGMPSFVLEDSSTGLNLLINGMGVAAADINRDGLLDYHISGFCSDNVVLRNNGANQFSDAGPVTSPGTCWGAAFADVDNDGDSDLYVGKDNFNSPTSGPNFLFRNDGSGTFSEYIATGAEIEPGEGLAMADFNHDGRMDFALQDAAGLIELLQNTTPASGNHWLNIRLSGLLSNKRGVGAKIRITSTSLAGTITQMQEVHAGSSHGSTHSYAIHFGFPAGSTIDQVVVEWPMGITQILTNVSPDQIVAITESADSDGDGLSDVDEVNIFGTDPGNIDTDGDTLSDFDEINYDGDPANYTPGADLNPLAADTDGDSYNDNVEIAAGSDPLDSLSTPPNGDINQDGLVNAADMLLATRHVFNLIVLNSDQIRQGDVYPSMAGDGSITISDLLLIQQLILAQP